MLVLLVANLIMLPVIISFFNDDVSGRWIAFNGISDTIFFLDIIVNFRTGIIRNDFVDDIILNPSEIAREYLRTWFALDLLSSLPIDYIFFAFRSYDHDRGDHLMQADEAIRIRLNNPPLCAEKRTHHDRSKRHDSSRVITVMQSYQKFTSVCVYDVSDLT
ncbi:uncharacterized protein DEA37_0013751 [Paragonimus westermani]|uniref:Ion transport domain-containing protein n=1 Tax=Paragonimus westermani TaxID=34504 RepID=A0A5J4NE71_9TREM|nr:uncharacterized protein DEA37_0013751 [Paragonimus westermani]